MNKKLQHAAPGPGAFRLLEPALELRDGVWLQVLPPQPGQFVFSSEVRNSHGAETLQQGGFDCLSDTHYQGHPMNHASPCTRNFKPRKTRNTRNETTRPLDNTTTGPPTLGAGWWSCGLVVVQSGFRVGRVFRGCVRFYRHHAPHPPSW